ncbi:TPA: hypothetical protein LTW63_003432 [Enterobacter hormaechei]|nr:hypothetical protein [Enterobacter hormaechei]HBL8874461.1 hypothetical protein [Enterobacter hormaechei]HBL8901455.1 hypothetical protein [Enterobacter hormaechei]HBL8914947.1 hypothetical protein [Enterobacter hormaechei]HBL8942834.1 hypothetical protein [Enterobacter hormaechei]
MTQKNDGVISMSASAAVTVTAKKSQSLIMILAITMMLLSFIACFLLYDHNPLYWVPFVPAGILLITCVSLALLTHKNTDLAGAHATVIESGGPSGFKIVTDPRVDIASKSIVPLISVLANMHTLPNASGLVDENLNPIPNTELQAMQKVASINLDAQQACAEAVTKFTPLPDSEPLISPVISVTETELENLTPQKFIYIDENDGAVS